MTNEQKQLLLKDLCARLPYGVKVCDDLGRIYELQIGNAYLIDLFYENGDYIEPPIKAYLRPMSSMTEEEIKKFEEVSQRTFGIDDIENTIFHREGAYGYFPVSIEIITNSIDYLNSIHVDYRGLIEQGLALSATDDMYNTKND